MTRYLVTGGAGFIGSHLVSKLLHLGYDVRVLDNLSTGARENVPSDADFMLGDICDAQAVRAATNGVDGCFHLAAIASVQASNEDWWGTHQTNLGGAINVFNGALRAKNGPLPIVYASSAAVYGDNQNVPLGECAHARPLTAYGADKLGCELHAAAAATAHGFGSVGLRFFNVYGPRQNPHSPYSGVLSIFAERLLRGAGVTVFGDGQQTRDFVFVGDVCDALSTSMQRCRDGAAAVYNVCTGKELSVLGLANAIIRLTASHGRIDHAAPRTGDIRRSVGDPSSLFHHLGVRPGTAMDEGLVETLEWMAIEHAENSENPLRFARNHVAA